MTAAWTPLVTGRERATLVERIRDLVAADADAAERPPTLLAHCDRAVLRAYLAQDDTVPDPGDEGGAALAEAVAALGQVGGALDLFGGACHLGWTAAHVADGEAVDELAATIDRLVLAALAAGHPAEYDLVSGVVGVGVYALERGAQGAEVLERVVGEFERRAIARGDGVAWHTPVEQVPPSARADLPEGRWDLGLAHGTPGVIALLARVLASGLVDPARTAALLDRAVGFVLGAAPPRAEGRFACWVPDARPSGRLAWCYEDLGVAFALLAAARARGREDWGASALELARACATRPAERAAIREPTLCHGAFGAVHLFARLHHATGEAGFADASRRWLAHGLELPMERADRSLVTGTAGCALALHAAISDVEPSWDRRLLVDLDRA